MGHRPRLAPVADMWLVLCHAADEAARWAYAEWADIGSRVELVTDMDLVGARWEHRVDATGARTVISLADGRVIDSARVRGALNRFLAVPPVILAPIAPRDREYAAAEIWALWLSWLAGLPGPVLNPASARGLSGAWRPWSEWSMLAAQAGLPSASVSVRSGDGTDLGLVSSRDGWSDWPPFASVPEDVIVVGDAVFSRDRLAPTTRRACRRLVVLAGTPVIGLRFGPERSRARTTLVSVTTLPDLRVGGQPLVAALGEALGVGAAA